MESGSAPALQLASCLSIIEDRVLTTGHVPIRRNRGLRPALVLLLVWLACAAYEGALLKRGWVPHDDGTFAFSAQRVLQGEMPHRDFDELYTGGLTYLNSAAFRVWGANFATLRWLLFVFFLAWVPAVFYLASRLVRPLAAGLITCLAVAASVPVYSSPVPSWYNLFFATFGTAAVLRFLEGRDRWWLAIAGFCAGLSFLAKIWDSTSLRPSYSSLSSWSKRVRSQSPHHPAAVLQVTPSLLPLVCWPLCSCSLRP